MSRFAWWSICAILCFINLFFCSIYIPLNEEWLKWLMGAISVSTIFGAVFAAKIAIMKKPRKD
jgi:hypothetical protein